MKPENFKRIEKTQERVEKNFELETSNDFENSNTVRYLEEHEGNEGDR